MASNIGQQAYDEVQNGGSGGSQFTSADDPTFYLSKQTEKKRTSTTRQGPMPGGGTLPPLIKEEEGSATTKTSSQVKSLYTMSATEIMKLQQRLLRAGFYGQGATSKVVTGVPDAATRAAYVDAMTDASYYYTAGQKVTLDDVIDRAGAARDDAGLNSQIDNPKPTIQIDNPQDLQDVINKASQNLVGREYSAEELGNAFIQEYQAKQIATETAFNNSQEAGKGGVVVNAPSEQVAAEDYIRRTRPNEVGAHDVAKTGEQFFQLLKGVGG